MVAFELSMPNRGSWNNRWTGEDRRYVRVYDQRTVPKEYWGKDFYYTWSDGWTACVSVTQVDSRTASKLRRLSNGFCGYDWMISSIIKYGKIMTSAEEKMYERR